MQLLPFFRSMLIAGVLFTAAAPFEAEAHERRAIVRTADLDVQSPVGAHRLLRRLEGAAARVCDATLSSYYGALRRAYRECRHQVLERAVASVGSPSLSEAYAVRWTRR